MPLADYAKVLRALDTLPKNLQKHFKGWDDEKLKAMSDTDYIAMLPGILATNWNELIAVIAVPTDKDVEFMSKLDLPDAVDVIAAILELNNVPRIIAAVKKMLALQAKVARPEAQN